MAETQATLPSKRSILQRNSLLSQVLAVLLIHISPLRISLPNQLLLVIRPESKPYVTIFLTTDSVLVVLNSKPKLMVLLQLLFKEKATFHTKSMTLTMVATHLNSLLVGLVTTLWTYYQEMMPMAKKYHSTLPSENAQMKNLYSVQTKNSVLRTYTTVT